MTTNMASNPNSPLTMPATPLLPLRDLAPVLLVWLVLALLPIGRLSELPVLAAAVWMLVLLVRDGRALLKQPALRLALALFACYWLPALISALDAVEPGKTWPQVAGQLRFGLFALFVAATLRMSAQWQWLLRASALLLALWVADAWIQALFGAGLAGASAPDRLSGIFGADNLKLGGALAALSPLLLAYAQRRWGPAAALVTALLLAGVILLAGARAAWLVYGLVLAGWFLMVLTSGKLWRGLLALAMLASLSIGIGVIAWQTSPVFEQRIDRTLHLVTGDRADLDHALTGRLSIWRTAAVMAREHPVNGVGVRGFRHAYPEHAAEDDRWLGDEQAAHPHQLVLELLAETGLIGLLAWLFAAGLLVRTWWRASADRRAAAWPPVLALVAMCFPLNTHYAFYSSWWGLFFWWLLALAVAVLHVDTGSERPRR